MLELLVKYAREHELDPEPGFKPKYARWAVMASPEGRYIGVVELGDPTAPRNKGALFGKCPDLSHAELIGGGETRCHFLIESAETVALYGQQSGSDRTRAKHRFFVTTLEEAAIEVPELRPFALMLGDDAELGLLRADLEAHRARPTDGVTLAADGAFVVESTAWHEWWRAWRRALGSSGGRANDDTAARAICMATGEVAQVLPTHPKIEGLSSVGGLPTGDVLVGCDKEAYCSYGLTQSANAPVAEQGASSYRAGLNDLIRNRGQRIAGTMIVHWFSRRIEPKDDPLAWLEESMEQQALTADSLATRFLESVRTGKRVDLAENYFYALTLSGASGRVMVRDWAEGRFGDLATNIAQWFEDLSIVSRYGDGLAPYPKFVAVLGALVRDLDDLAPPTVAKMWRVAVSGSAIPVSALAQAVRRAMLDIVGDRPANHSRYALIKAFHLRSHRSKGVDMTESSTRPYLNDQHPEPAYHCGRLMASMAELQHRALGDVGAGLVQRYYAAASTTPALVLGRLSRTSQFHLGKLEPGLARWYEAKLAGIWAALDGEIPRTLTLEQQSLFALGYYQEMAAMRRSRGNTKEEEQP